MLAQNNPVSVADSISDDAIVYPESMTEQLSDLLKEWQLDLQSAEIECKRGQMYIFMIRFIPTDCIACLP